MADEVGVNRVGCANGQTVLDEGRSNDTPSEDHATQEAVTGVDTAKHTNTKEGGGEFQDPAIVLDLDSTTKAESVEGPTDVPVVDLWKL